MTILMFEYELQKNRKLFLDKMKNSSKFSSSDVPDILKNDYKFFKAAIEIDGIWLCAASPDLRRDDNLVCEGLKSNGNLLDYLDNEFKNTKKYALLAVKDHGSTYEYVGETLKNDIKIILTAIKTYPASLMYMSDRIKDNKKIVLKAVAKNGACIEYASDRLKNDWEVVETALEKDSYSFNHIGEKYRNDRDLVIKYLKRDGYIYPAIGKKLKNDRELLLIALEGGYVEAYSYAGELLKEELRSKIGETNLIQGIKALNMKEKLDKKIPNKIEKNKNKIKV